MSPQRKMRRCLTAASGAGLSARRRVSAPARAETLATLSGHLFVDWNHNSVRRRRFVIAHAVVQHQRRQRPDLRARAGPQRRHRTL
jgi:hypothetical protein